MTIKLAVFTSDKHLWAMRGFAYQWQKYCGLPIDVVGFSAPKFKLPINFQFVSMGRFEDYPANKWSDVLINYLNQIEEEQIGLFLEDYWLIRKADTRALGFIERFMKAFPTALRFCLTTDRLYCGKITQFCSFLHYDIIQATPPTSYHLSTQASVFNKSTLLKVAKPGMTPWELELKTTPIFEANPDEYQVFGTRQFLFNYQIMIRAGKFERDGNWMYPARQLCDQDYNDLDQLGYTKPGKE